ncbi:MAG: hypothetical protein JNM93_11350 [Bacteriovoracaceae bacterium]|nr:hypothetical protein [Bacteriovoracaceae bacterium]
MKVIPFILLLILAACDAPVSTRNFQPDDPEDDPLQTTTTGGTTPTTTTATVTTTTGGTTGNGLGPGFENCNINPTLYTATIGYVAVCQSSQQQNLFKLKFSETDLDYYPNSTCLVPMHKYSTGSSRYIGPEQFLQHQANVVYTGQLYKFTNEGATALNSVMVLKCTSLSAFYNCMDAASLFIAQNCPYNVTTSCSNAAQSYMQSTCTSFTSQHGYIQVNF